MRIKLPRSSRPLYGLAPLLAILGISIGMVAFSQQQVQLANDHVLELATVVVGPGSSNNLGSQVNFTANDRVKWIIYTGSPQREPNPADLASFAKVGYPEVITGSVALPTGFSSDASTFKGPPNTTFSVSGSTVSWERQSELTTIASISANGSSVTISFVMDLQDYFQCDPGRDMLVAWDKIRVDHALRWGATGLSQIRVAVLRATTPAGSYTPLLDNNGNAVVITTNGTNPASVPTGIDISSVPATERNLRFDITFTKSNASSVALPSAIGSKPIDVIWRGDQAQVCFEARAPAPLGNNDYVTQVDTSYDRQRVNGVPTQLTAGKRLDPNNTAYKGYGPTVLTAQLPASAASSTSVLLQSSFDMDAHTGNLSAYTTTNSTIAAAPFASAAAAMKLSGDAATIPNRPVFTNKGGDPDDSLSTDSWGRLNFTWDFLTRGNAVFVIKESAEALAMRRTFTFLDSSTGRYSQYDTKAMAGGVAERRVEYLRGSRLRESSTTPLTNTTGANFRKRNSLLGPVVNSSPVWVPQTPQVGYPETLFPGYQSFRNNTVVDRLAPHVLYGGHDGMLHAFSLSATALSEAFAFIPNFLLEKAHRFTNGTQTQLGLTPFAIDSTPMVRDVNLSASGGGFWRTVVVSSLGRLNRGIFALDITTRFDNNKTASGFPLRATLWEYTHLSNAPLTTSTGQDIDSSELRDLGQMVYQPPIDETVGSEQIVRMNGGRWAAVVGNGINSHIGPDPARNGTGRAVLYLFFFGTNRPSNSTTQGAPNDVPWLRIPVSAENDAELAYNNGLLSPRPYDINGDGNVDVIYAGDMKGNLWRFDVTNLGSVKVTRLFKTANGKPIVATPVVRPYTDRSNASCMAPKACQFVSFGTGYPAGPLTPGPIDVGSDHALYGLIDVNTTSTSAGRDSSLMTNTVSAVIADNASDLEPRNLSAEPNATPVLRSLSGNALGNKKGWKLPLWIGEQLVANPRVFSDGSVLFTTGRYWPFNAPGPIYRSKRSWLTQVDLFTGLGKQVLMSGSNYTSSLAIAGPLYESPALLPSSPGSNMQYMVIQVPGAANASGNPNLPVVPIATNPALLGRLAWREIYGE